jgi:hypothetical protein
LRSCPEFGIGETSYIDAGVRSVLALLHDAPGGTVLALTNLAGKSCAVDLGRQSQQEGPVREVFANRTYDKPSDDLTGLKLDAYGYRWFRLRETVGR